jgi:hypothetical protein
MNGEISYFAVAGFEHGLDLLALGIGAIAQDINNGFLISSCNRPDEQN